MSNLANDLRLDIEKRRRDAALIEAQQSRISALEATVEREVRARHQLRPLVKGCSCYYWAHLGVAPINYKAAHAAHVAEAVAKALETEHR